MTWRLIVDTARLDTRLAKLGLLLTLFFFCALPLRAQALMPCDELIWNPNASYRLAPSENDWLFRSFDFNQAEDLLSLSVSEDFKAFIDGLRGRDISLVIAALPMKSVMEQEHLDFALFEKLGVLPDIDIVGAQRNYQSAIKNFQAMGAIAPDLTLLDAEVEQFYLKRDHHWTAEAARAVANAIAESVQQHFIANDALNTIAPQRFTTYENPKVLQQGSSAVILEEYCNIRSPLEVRSDFLTASAAPPSDLFANNQPEIVLVGTSFSHPNYNFEGFLKDALARDVLNLSIVGGGLFASLEHYLSSDSFLNHPAKIIVWEFPAHEPERLSLTQIRRLQGALQESCDSLWTEEVVVDSPNFLVVQNLQYERQALDTIEFIFPQQRYQQFRLAINYHYGYREELTITRSQRVQNHGRYRLLLHSQVEHPLESIELTDIGNGTPVQVSYCRGPE